jgi:hypothetical protein
MVSKWWFFTEECADAFGVAAESTEFFIEKQGRDLRSPHQRKTECAGFALRVAV